MDKINLEIERVKREYEKLNLKRKIRVYKRHKIKNSIKDIFKIDRTPNLEIEMAKKKYEILNSKRKIRLYAKNKIKRDRKIIYETDRMSIEIAIAKNKMNYILNKNCM